MGMKPRRPTFDEALAERVRVALGPRADVVEKRMFGGLCFMVRGHMTVGVEQTRLMVRTGPDAHAGALEQRHARPMDFTGRPLVGYVYVEAAGLRTDGQVADWVGRALAFTGSLPAK